MHALAEDIELVQHLVCVRLYTNTTPSPMGLQAGPHEAAHCNNAYTFSSSLPGSLPNYRGRLRFN